jgi:hypothetical protein
MTPEDDLELKAAGKLLVVIGGTLGRSAGSIVGRLGFLRARAIQRDAGTISDRTKPVSANEI